VTTDAQPPQPACAHTRPHAHASSGWGEAPLSIRKSCGARPDIYALTCTLTSSNHTISEYLHGIIVALIVLALVPWLGAVFDSIELPGGLKVHYLEQQLNEAQTELSRAQTETEHAKRAAASASQKAAVAFAANKPDSRTRHADRQLKELVVKYNEVRAAQESSSRRTAILTEITGRMVALSGQVSHYHWRKALESDDPGLRVAGYAWLYAKPNPRAAQLLVNTVTVREETHFGQYWGLEALQRCLPLADAVTVAELTPKLKEFLSKLPTDSDRHYELSNLLERLTEPSRR
jgi:hypothetical protein